MRQKQSGRSVAAKEFITIAFAEDMDLAQQYQRMLEEKQIPVKVRKVAADTPESAATAVAVMVPEEFIDIAYKLIQNEVNYDDFFQTAFMERVFQDRQKTLLENDDNPDPQD